MSTQADQENKLRQRVDGVLHRSLAASLTIREAIPGETEDGLMRLRLSVSSEEPYLRSSWWDEPWFEVLGHKDGEVDLTRLNGGAVVLGNHDRWTPIGNTPLAGIGAVEKAWLNGKRLEADIVISRREALADLRQDIMDNLVRNVSIGYTINERTLTKANGEGKPDEYRVTSWTPFEISLVDIPADATVGMGRSQEEATARYRVLDLHPQPSGVAGNQTKEQIMPGQNSPADDQTRSATPVAATPNDILAVERARVQEITALGRMHNMQADAERAIESGAGVDAFRAAVLDKLKPAPSMTPAETRDIGMSGSEVERYSFARALLVAMDPTNPAYRKVAGFELEASEAARSQRNEIRKERDGGITIPPDVMRASIASSPDVAQAAMRLMNQAGNGSAAFRDLVVGTATAGGHTVATNLLSGSFIDMLRARARVLQMGATVLTDLSGNIAIPRQTGGATCYWVGENVAVTESQPTFDQVPLTPKTVGTFTDFSRRLLLQSSLDVEAFVRAELAIALAIYGIDYAALNGSGSGDQPTGLFNASGVGAVVMGDNGAAPSWAKVVEFETAIANANADVGAMAYLTNSKVRGSLKTTEKFTGSGKEIWQPGRDSRNGIGEVNGYDAYVSNNIGSAYTKGSSAGICSGMAFGNWADLLIGMWGGLDLMLDPYANATSGGKRVVALQDCDIAVRHPGSFAISKDILA